jgi:hypothetical protein
MLEEVKKIIEQSSTKELSEIIVKTYLEIEKSFSVKSYQICELQAGHFVEAIRRFIEFKGTGQYQSISSSLGSFSNSALVKYEGYSINESYRIIIPRVLYSIYCIRNKRGIGHLSEISANNQDATFIISGCKWVVSEIIRIESNIDIDQSSQIVDEITNRKIDSIWEIGDRKRILIKGLTLKESILMLLYKSTSISLDNLFLDLENGDKSYLKRCLKKMHADREIEYKNDGNISISPLGVGMVEEIIIKNTL